MIELGEFKLRDEQSVLEIRKRGLLVCTELLMSQAKSVRLATLASECLAQELQTHPKFNDFLTPEIITSLYKSAPLHDIGKVGVPDHILLKPGKLSEPELEEMKKHAQYGYDAINAAEKTMTGGDSFLFFAKQIALYHQEKWDGSGYPEGLAGEDIPIAARLMAVADVYDALISRRAYKEPFSHEKAVGIITQGRGSHFDPDMVDAFLTISEAFLSIVNCQCLC
ncbi:MAG: putative two-component system response regulator [Alteromonadaceae bacterium]